MLTVHIPFCTPSDHNDRQRHRLATQNQLPSRKRHGEVVWAGSLRAIFAHQNLVSRRLIAQLHAQNPMLQVVALSSLPDGRANALATGVDGFVSKTESPTELTSLLLRLHETDAF